MFRILSRIHCSTAHEAVLTPILPSSCSLTLIGFASDTPVGTSGRCFSSMPHNGNPASWKRIDNRQTGLLTVAQTFLNSANASLIKSLSPSLMLEQRRCFWGKEGRPGWRRKRSRILKEKEEILNPQSPVVNKLTPWPDFDELSLPSEFNEEEQDKPSPEETILAQNAVVQQINEQIQDKSAGRLFAVIHVAAKQFKVTPEDIIVLQHEFAPNIGDQIRLNKVLLVGSKDFTLIGRPLIDDGVVRIEATVIEKTLSYTKMHFKMLKRKNYRRLKFHKTPFTMLRINLIELMQPLNLLKSDLEPETLKTEQQRST